MAPLNFVKKARKPIYENGRYVKYSGREGSKREGQTLTKLDRTLPQNSQDKIIIHVGESYYWWQFIRGPIHYSKDKPRRSQLTQSEFLGWLYDLEDEINSYDVPDIATADPDTIKGDRDGWVSQINEKKEELEEKLENMPESLRDNSSSGQILTERIEGLESWADEFETVEIEWDDDDLMQEATDEWEHLHPQALRDEDPSLEEEKEAAVQEIFQRMKLERIEEIIMELQNVSSNL